MPRFHVNSQHIMMCRQRANELLIQQNKTIYEIAMECGFNSDNSFYKAYRRFYGHAPSVKRD